METHLEQSFPLTLFPVVDQVEPLLVAQEPFAAPGLFDCEAEASAAHVELLLQD